MGTVHKTNTREQSLISWNSIYFSQMYINLDVSILLVFPNKKDVIIWFKTGFHWEIGNVIEVIQRKLNTNWEPFINWGSEKLKGLLKLKLTQIKIEFRTSFDGKNKLQLKT